MSRIKKIASMQKNNNFDLVHLPPPPALVCIYLTTEQREMQKFALCLNASYIDYMWVLSIIELALLT